MRRLAVLTSHPIQYYGPLFRELGRRVDLHVFFAHQQTPEQQAAAGFGTSFSWDVDLTAGYAHSFLRNVAADPGVGRFAGADTPDVAPRLKAGGFDAVLTLGWHLKALVQGIVAAKRLGLPVMVRGDSQLGGPRSGAKRAVKALSYPVLLRAFDAALYVGRRSRDYYRHYGYPDRRLFSSPHCIDTEWFATRATPDRRLALREALGVGTSTRLVLFAGKLVPFKRPLDVVEACAALRRDGLDVAMLVAGSGELAGAVASRAAELGLPAHMLGFQNQSEMPAAYAAADVLALPSNGRETWGLVANEALACGTSLVLSDAAGCAADLGGGDAGRTYPMGDIRALAAALRQTLNHPPSPTAIGTLSGRHGLAAAAEGVLAGLDFVAPAARGLR